MQWIDRFELSNKYLQVKSRIFARGKGVNGVLLDPTNWRGISVNTLELNRSDANSVREHSADRIIYRCTWNAIKPSEWDNLHIHRRLKYWARVMKTAILEMVTVLRDNFAVKIQTIDA